MTDGFARASAQLLGSNKAANQLAEHPCADYKLTSLFTAPNAELFMAQEDDSMYAHGILLSDLMIRPDG